MNDKKLALYAIRVYNLNNFRGSSNWYPKHQRAGDLYMGVTGSIGTTPLGVSIGVLRDWVRDPAKAMEYLTLPQREQTRIRVLLAQYFLENGI